MSRANEPRYNLWDSEYQNPKLISLDDQPQASVLTFLRWLKKERKKNGDDMNRSLSILDLGCGVGRNSNSLADQGHQVIGYDISETAIRIATERAEHMGLGSVHYEVRSIGEPYPIEDSSIDLIFDVTSSNALSETERKMYLRETFRVMKSGGWMFVRALKKEGDIHAKRLVNDYPGPEKDTYVMPGTGFTERVFSRQDFLELYGAFFSVHQPLISKTGYQQIDGRSFKRHYLVGYFQKI